MPINCVYVINSDFFFFTFDDKLKCKTNRQLSEIK